MGRRGGLRVRQEALQQLEETFIERRPRHGLAGRLDQRIVAGAERHRHLPQHAHAYAGRTGGALDGIAVLHGVGEHGGALVGGAVRGAIDVEADLRVLAVVALEILVAGDARTFEFVDVVALAEQGPPPGVARRVAARRDRPGIGVVLGEVFFFEGGFGSGASRQDGCQGSAQRKGKTRGDAGHEKIRLRGDGGIIGQGPSVRRPREPAQ
ncbi:hypothetical protein LMG3458_05812 [Achromobacter deleyi]|uniref:Uncharacterized protein n=1 Tax=Achromobacter deleyi TaxID=1353891 RepID=A0A6S7ANQ9_9BURK|nr:hypothetical protein LMG3458_05812 [Achromobacter deleyi]CAB3918948.1 hypothetical protein LMG3481_05209 [Achromobacter deleyi]CAB3925693.1 hypothetical protein LMG3482_05867 [Achromobacter deleyi]